MPIKLLINLLIKIILLILLLLIYFNIASQNTGNHDFLVLFTNFLIMLYSWYRIFFNKQGGYSLRGMFYLFALFFFGIAPLIQYKYSIETVIGYRIDADTYLYINCLILMVFLVIDSCYSITFKKFDIFHDDSKREVVIYDNLVLKVFLVGVVLAVFLHILWSNNFNFISMLLRGGTEVQRIELDSSVMNKLLSKVFRPIPVFVFIMYYIWGKNFILKTFFAAIVLIVCAPTALARLSVAAYYIPIILVVFPLLRKSYYFVLTYVTSLLVAFPVLEVFRNFNTNTIYQLGERIPQLLTEVYAGMTYDSYQSFAFVFQNHIVLYGKQLVGVLLFWVPRSWWINKPVGSGYTVAHLYNLGWDNISMNFLGEGYINFGVVGVFIFGIFLAWFMAIFDRMYWNKYQGKIQYFFCLYYLILLANLTFFLRGDLMYGTTVILGSFLSCFLVQQIFLIFGTLKRPFYSQY